MSFTYDYISEEYENKVNNFDCGNEDVNEFLKEHASELQNHNFCITKLYFDDDNLVGFVSVRLGEVAAKDVNIEEQGWLDRLPQSSSYSHKYPIVYVQYLGVDKRYKRKGYARKIMIEVFKSTYKLIDDFGCNFIYLESYLTEEALGLYKELLFVEFDRDESLNTAQMLFKIERKEDQ